MQTKFKKRLKKSAVILFIPLLFVFFVNCSKSFDTPTATENQSVPPTDSSNTGTGDRDPDNEPDKVPDEGPVGGGDTESDPQSPVDPPTIPPSPGNPQTTFYVDSVLGSDANSGFSPDTPWQTLGKVSNSAFVEGTTVYLKRGGVWYEQLDIPSSKITIDSYGTGNLPEINGSTLVTSWVGQGGSVFAGSVTLSSGEALGNISQNGVMLRPLDWKGTVNDTLGGAITGTYTFDNAAKKIYIKISGAPTGYVYLASRKLYGISAINKSDVTIKNVFVTRFSLNGINFQNCQNCSIYSSTITNGGGVASGVNPTDAAQYIYAGNGIEYDTNSRGGLVQNVTVTDIFDSCISPQTYRNNETVSGIQIRGSNLDKCGFAGVEISVLSNGGTTGSKIENILVSGLSIIRSGQGWSGRRYGTEGHGIRIKADIAAGTMSSIVIEKTTIQNSAGSSIKLGGNVGLVDLKQLTLFDGVMGIDVQEALASSLKLRVTSSGIYRNRAYGILFNAPFSAGFEVIHNTFYQNGSTNFSIVGSMGAAKIQNNIFDSSVKMAHVYISTNLTGATVDNNCYRPWAHSFGYNNVTYSTLADFKAASGFESQGVWGNTGLAGPGGGNLTLYSTSECRGIGATGAGVTQDRAGSIFAVPPSAGAYEYQDP